MRRARSLDILFIGNSHTYCNDMPLMVQRRAEEEGFRCRAVMLAQPGWYLAQHAESRDVRFNILYGHYDYVVLQEHAHPFGPEEKFREAAAALAGMIREAGSIPVLYETWARKTEPEMQAHMNEIHRQIAAETGALLAPVGENWWTYQASWPEIEMYSNDGAHASDAGSGFAAKIIWETIRAEEARRTALSGGNDDAAI